MKKLLYIFSILFLASCSKEELSDSVCLSDDCLVNFWIDELVQPNSYQDDNGYWHIQFEGVKYFTIKGEIDNFNPEYEVNGVPLIEVAFDSDKFIFLDDITFTIPRYSPFGLYTDSQFATPVPVANQLISPCFILSQLGRDPLNIAGYQMSSKADLSKPYAERLFGTYSSNTYKPQQQILLDPRWKGDTLTVFTRTKLNYDLGDSKEIDINFKIIID